MQKFTKYNTEYIDPNKTETLFDNGYVKIIDYKDWSLVEEKDMVVCIPYLKDEGCILLRSEYIPTYQYDNRNAYGKNNVTNFLTCISGSVEKGESPVQTLRRELKEEAGIVVSDFKEIDVYKSLHVSKGNINKYHLVLLELRYMDYRQTKATGDGSESEAKSRTIKLDLNYINDILTHDMVTEYLLQMIKFENNI